MSTLSDSVMRRLEVGRSGTEICTELMAVGWSKEAADTAYRDVYQFRLDLTVGSCQTVGLPGLIEVRTFINQAHKRSGVIP